MAKETKDSPENAEQAVIEIARKVGEIDTDEVFTLTSGARVKVHPITAALIDQVTARIKDPVAPVWHDEEKDRDVINYADPAYIKGLADVERERGIAAMDAIVMFGFELVDGVPEDSVWLRKLSLLGIVIDDTDEVAVEFNFKKYVAVAPDEISLVTDRSGISSEELQAAEASFQRNS